MRFGVCVFICDSGKNRRPSRFWLAVVGVCVCEVFPLKSDLIGDRARADVVVCVVLYCFLGSSCSARFVHSDRYRFEPSERYQIARNSR